MGLAFQGSDDSRAHRKDVDGERDGFQNRDYGRNGPDLRGCGPKRNQRSADRICNDVFGRLLDDHDVDELNIEVLVSNREVTPSGEINIAQETRSAGDCAGSVSTVEHAHTNPKVRKSRTKEESDQHGKPQNTR